MAGATATATSPVALAQTAQITLVNNSIDTITGNNLSLMVTTGHPFGTIASTIIFNNGPQRLLQATGNFNNGQRFIFVASHTRMPGGPDSFAVGITNSRSGVIAGEVRHGGTTPQKSFYLFPITLTDPNLPGNPNDTNALLDVEAFNQSDADHTIALLSVFYPLSGNTAPNLTINSNSGTVTGSYTNVGASTNGGFTPANAPEPSGLALLALGAGGILARRRRKG
jgi:hypothetical protein